MEDTEIDGAPLHIAYNNQSIVEGTVHLSLIPIITRIFCLRHIAYYGTNINVY